jgi:hypothetical protein
MLAMSDVNIDQFFSIFANTGVSVAFLVPTPTGYGKSIMDATAPVRELFKESGLHDYELQGQGQESKVVIESFFVYHDRLEKSYASLYRPVTKKGDPRIWFKDLKRYCSPCNLLSLIIIEKRIYVINLSNPSIASSLQSKGFVFDILLEAAHKDRLIADELLSRIQEIHSLGFIPSITPGDPGVGDTLEHALGIERNNSRSPDYKGIELKATRLTRNGSSRQTTRSTLFTKVPDVGMSYREIIDNYGKVQIPRGETIARLQLYETFRVSRPNAYDLVLDVDANNDQLRMLHQELTSRKFVSAWYMNTLKQALLLKHHETFWVKALSETRNGREFFRYDKILHTKNPNTSLLAPLFEADKITVDLAAHYKPDGKWRDHGVLFKMMPDDLPLLLGTPIEYDLTK